MKDPFVNELRLLRPSIRRNFLAGKQVYKDQEKPPQIEAEWDKRVNSAVNTLGHGGRRSMKDGHVIQVLARDTIKRAPHSSDDAIRAAVDS